MNNIFFRNYLFFFLKIIEKINIKNKKLSFLCSKIREYIFYKIKLHLDFKINLNKVFIFN